MALADNLLKLARAMAGGGRGRPDQGRLRRAISTAYYAVFHRLVQRATEELIGRQRVSLSHVVSRSFEHGAMRQLAEQLRRGAPPDVVSAIIPVVSADLMQVAAEFVDLQIARHDADYNLALTFNKADVERALDAAERVFAALDAARPSEELRNFLAILPMWGQLKRR